MNILTNDEVYRQAPAAFTETHSNKLSNRYRTIETMKVVEPLLADGWSVTRASQAQYRRQCEGPHGFHIIGLSRPELQYRDEQVEVLLFNSHNGTKKFEVRPGIYRMVCSNGLIDSSVEFDEVRARHFYSLEVMKERTQQIVERAPKIIAKIDAWKSLELTEEAQLEFLKYAMTLRFPGNPDAQNITGFNEARRWQDHGSDLWRTFNRVQENLIKGGPMRTTMKGKQRATPQVRSIHRNVALNEGIWQAAEKIAAGEPLFGAN